jgi:hypothetical protein
MRLSFIARRAKASPMGAEIAPHPTENFKKMLSY